MAIDPSGPALSKFFSDPDPGPVVMLNLLRFVDGGEAHYAAYSAAVRPLLAKVGGEVLYAGRGSSALVAEAGQAWDAVVIVRYPNRAAFARMVMDPEYRAVVHHRTAALRESVLQPTTTWEL